MVDLKYTDKKTHIIYLKPQIFLFFSEDLSMSKLLKRREIFVVLDKLCLFFCLYVYIYIYKKLWEAMGLNQ